MPVMEKPLLDTSELDYDLPQPLIAQRPPHRRGDSRLLVVDRATGTLRDSMFRELPSLLAKGDTLILNNTRVLPARIEMKRATGGRIDGLFLDELGEHQWKVLLTGTARLREGERITLQPPEVGATLELIRHEGGGRWVVRLLADAGGMSVLEAVGRPPLPPYIHRTRNGDESTENDRRRYQTIYAERPGAVAAPTAGLHFTERIFAALDDRGIERAFVTLHVGLGTFAPVKTERLDDHTMHSEWYELSQATATNIADCRASGGRIVAVGTTSVRVLESCTASDGVRAASGWTDIFIRPPYAFRAVDALLTNFHLPRSTLMALVMAFTGRELTRAAYRHAVENEYRFYTYGDAMLIV